MGTKTFFWAIALGSVVLLLVAAKAHGRQLRVERELAGFASVHFGAKNDPWIEALWRRDRIGFWSAYAVGAALLTATFVLLGRSSSMESVIATIPWGARIVGGLLWSAAFGFAWAGGNSLVRFARALRQPLSASPARLDPRWAAGVLEGSVAWWTLMLSLVLLFAVVTWRYGGTAS